MPEALLATKLYIPPGRENAVARPRLTEKLLALMERSGGLALLSCPAGYGKTTLLSEFVTRIQRPVAWVSLDEGDNDPVRFWSYLIAACQKVHAGAGASAPVLLQSPQPLPAEIIPTILINDISSLDGEMVLVLDDYHTIQNEAIHEALLFLLEHMPGNLHVVVSTRNDPPWPLSRFRARNQLIEVRAQDLRFTAQEAEAFLNQMMGLNVPVEGVEALEERTEGWVAGLQLVALSMKGRNDLSGFVRAFTGSHVYIAEYLIEEVLERQPQAMQEFLMQTSLLERLNGPLCETVTGCTDGHAILAALYRANLFVLPLDDEGKWFRYHHLFADLLQARLRQKMPADGIATLHRGASNWYEQAGMIPEAIQHAVAADDDPLILRLVGKYALPMILKAYFKTVEDWLQVIPAEYLEASPQINMAFAWMFLIRGMFAQAAPYVERLQAIFSAQVHPADKEHPAEQAQMFDRSLQGEWLALQSMLLNAQGETVQSQDLAEQALKILPENETQVRTMIYMGLAEAYQKTLDYERATEACELIIQQGRASGDAASEMFGLSYLGRMVLLQGKLHRTYEIAYEAMQRIEWTGSFSPISATLYGELAQIYYQWHQLEEARRYFLRSVELSTLGGFVDAKIYHSVFLSRLFQMEGDLPASNLEIEKALDLMRMAAPAFMGEEVIAQQVSIYLALDRPAAAQAALRPYGFSFEGGLSYPELTKEAGIPHPAGLLYNSALSILLYQAKARHEAANIKDSIKLADLVIAGSLRCRHLPIALKTYLLRGQLQAAQGNEPARRADILRALELAEPEGFISIFVEEGQQVAETLKTLLKRNLLEKVQHGYVETILAAYPGSNLPSAANGAQPGMKQRNAREVEAMDEPFAAVEPLTLREMEVLQLIAAGYSNQAVAEKLVITVSAVKKHTGNIYGKLNVNSRTQAVALAQQLGILPTER